MSPISPERWSRLERIVDGALDLPAEARGAWLAAECGDDSELRADVEAWLAACAAPTRFPEESAAEYGAALLEDAGVGGAASAVDADGGGDPGERASSQAAAPSPSGARPGRVVASGTAVSGGRIGPYRLVRELGRGGMGTVFLAARDDGQYTREVALKLTRRGGGDIQIRRRFLEERQILARLEHPNIVGLLDGGVSEDGQPWFVMPYVEGANIDRWCDARALTVEARLGLFLEVCEAVQYAHGHQVVHRDLKPGNILVGMDGRARLLDFGIAKLLHGGVEGEDAGGLTRTGERLLTPEYASPEQIRGEAVTPATDVYALGVLLHGLLTGRGPYRRANRTPHDVERAVLEEEPTLPSDAVTRRSTAGRRSAAAESPEAMSRGTTPGKLRRRLSGDLDAIVLRALEKDPARRYPSAGALAADLRRHLNGQPIRARGRAPGHRLRMVARRHRLSLAAGSAGVLLGATVLALASGGPARLFGILAGRSEPLQVLAVGRIADYRDGHAGEPMPLLTDMLATNLARTRDLAVVSAARMYGLLGEDASGAGADAEAWARAARRAGATVLLDGAVYSMPGGGVRLDLRRVDVGSGSIAGAQMAAGGDLFSVADSATLRLVADLGLAPPPGSIADVTTRSLDAYGLYIEGMEHFHRREREAAEAAFAAALEADSTFAMAAYFSARNNPHFWRTPSATAEDRELFEGRMSLALRLSERTSDRERLMIRAYDAVYHLSPAMLAVAETLSVRYPQEVEGHLAVGSSLELAGDFAAALPHLRRAFQMDSTSVREGERACPGCEALELVVETLVLMDSLGAAEREARRWLELQPASSVTRVGLSRILDAAGKYGEGENLLRGPIGFATSRDSVLAWAQHWIRSGDAERAEAELRGWLRTAEGPLTSEPLLFLCVTLRLQGRFAEALQVARRLRAAVGGPAEPGAAPPSALVEAQSLLDLGRLQEAQVLFDSIARWPALGQPASVAAAQRVLAATMAAAARHQAGDTVGLAALADSLEMDGARAFMLRPRAHHLYLRGLLALARDQDGVAIERFREALASSATDFVRVNLELARALLRQGRPLEAIEALRPAARGWFLDSTNLHATLTDVHELTGHAWDAAGEPDSAAVHWRRVAASLSGADPELAARRDYAKRRAEGGAAASGVVGAARIR
jgi:serine/threonine protein kinase/tetratricopeptide (TPR) repeat protein